jgi:hypothetical protein
MKWLSASIASMASSSSIGFSRWEGRSGLDEPVRCPQLLGANHFWHYCGVLVVLAGGSPFADHILRKIGDHLLDPYITVPLSREFAEKPS